MQNRIGEILAHQGRTATWLARRMGCNMPYLNRIIKGHVKPGPDFRRKCALALDLPESLLFFASDRPIDRSDSDSTEREPIAV